MLWVYRKRDDLPLLTIPTVVLLFAMITGCTTVAASVMREEWLTGHAISGFFAVLPLVCISIAAYGILIVLWRQAASMAVTVLSMITAGYKAGWFLAAVLCLSVFACAYVFASAFLLRLSRYRRIVQLSAAAAVCLLAASLLFAGFVWQGVPVTAFPTRVFDCIEKILFENTYLPMTTASARSAARSITIALPALWLVTAEAGAWICDWICRHTFSLMNCARYFLPAEDKGITIPRYFGVLVLILSFLLLTTSHRKNPLIYTTLTNCVIAMFPSVTYVGMHEAVLRIRENMADAYLADKGQRARTIILTVSLLVWSIAVIGGGTLCFLFAIYGAWQVLKKKKTHPPEKSE